MVWLTIIGSASIQIRADDKYFEPDVRRAVKKIKNVEIQLRIDGDISKASKKIRDLRYRITNKDAVLKIDADITKAEEKMRKFLEKFIDKDLNFNVVANTKGANTQLTDLRDRFTSTRVPFTAQANTRAANAALAFTARRRNAEINARISPQTLAALTGLFNTLTGTLPIEKIKSAITGVAANFEGLATKAALATAALGAVSAAALTGAANLVGIASDLTQLGGLIGLMPAGLLALRTVLLANKFAWEGFGDAAKDNSAKANEALAKLPPNAQAAALALRGVREQISKPVQEAFWEAAGDSLQKMVEAQLPSIISGMTRIGGAWGRFNKEVFDTVAELGDFTDVFDNITRMVDSLAPAIKPALEGLSAFIGVGSTFLPKFGVYISELAARFGDWATKAAESGEMLAWMNNGIKRAQELGSIIKSTAQTFEGLANAARLSGAAGLTDLANGMQNIANIVNSEPFQSRLVSILEGARSGTDALGDGIQNLTEYMGESADAIRIFLDETGKIGGEAFNSIRSLFDGTGLGNGLYMALSGLREGLVELQPGFGQLGSAIGSLGRIAGELFVNMAPGLNQLFETINGVVLGLEDGIKSAMPVFNEFVQSILNVVQGPIIDLANFLGDALEAFAALPDGIQTAIMALGLFLALKGKFVGFFAPFIASLGDFVTNTKAKFEGVEGAANKMKTGIGAAFGGLTSALGGPIGIALLLITGAFADFAREQQNTKTQIDNVAGALEASGGTINGVVTGVVEDNLRMKDSFLGVFEAASSADIAKELGIPLKDVAAAASGVPGAMDRVQDSLRRSGEGATRLGTVIQGLSTIFRQTAGAVPFLAQMIDFFGIGQSKGDLLNKTISEQAKIIQEGQKQYQGLADQMNTSTVSAARLAQNYVTLADATASASSRAAALLENIDLLSDVSVSSRDAARDHATAMFDLQDAMAKLGEAQGKVLDSTGRMDDGFRNSLLKDGLFHTASREAITFSEEMDAAAASIVDMGIAEMRRLEATGASTAQAQAGALDVMNAQTQVLKDSLVRLGFDAATADGIIKQLGLDPTKLTGAMVLNTEDAEGKAQRLALMLGAIQNGNWEVALAASTQEVQDKLLEVDAYREAYNNGGWEAVVGMIDETGPGIADLMVRLSEAKSAAEIDAIIRAEFLGKPAFQEANAEIDYFGNRIIPEAKLGANAAGVEAGVAAGSAQIDGFSTKEGRGKLLADDQTHLGVESAQSKMNSLVDVFRSLFGLDQTNGGVSSAQATMNTLMDVTRILFGNNQTKGARDAAQGTLETLVDVTRSLFGRNQAQGGRNAAQGTLETLMDVTRSLFAANQAAGGKNAAQGTIDALRGKTVDLNANDQASGVVRRVDGMGIANKSFNIIGVLSGVSATVRALLGMADGGIMKRGVQSFADGGILNRASAPAVKAFASGGMENHVAQIARGAWPVRIWAEPETGGEAYLPLHPSKRKRSLEILREVMKEFGLGHLAMQFADGGMIPRSNYSTPEVVSSRYSNTISTIGQIGVVSTDAAPNMTVIVNPSQRMDETQIGESAAKTLYWNYINRNK